MGTPVDGPRIIQGGMGVAISGWQLARAVARTGQLGVVSGTALEVVCARRLQHGDPGGDVRRALAQFPIPGMADRVLRTYYVEGGKPPDAPFRPVLRFSLQPVAGPGRADHRGQLRRGVPGQGGPRRCGRHQLPAQDRAAAPVRLLRRDAGRRRPRADGRRQPGRTARAARRAGPPRAGGARRPGAGRHVRGRRAGRPLRSAGRTRDATADRCGGPDSTRSSPRSTWPAGWPRTR